MTAHPELRALGACCTALAATPGRLAKPRPPDARLLGSITDVGAPTPRRQVRLLPLPQARTSAPSAVVAAGMWRPARISMGMAAFLVEHPKATFLIDPAMCGGVHQRVLPEMPLVLRPFISPEKPVTGLVDALAAVGRSPSMIDFCLPTHLHWDHVSGLLELPGGIPLRVQREEQDWAMGSARAPVGVARGPLGDRRFDPLELDGPPVLTFRRSRDLFGDGSVVLVDLPGHTPGSVGVLLATTNGRVLLVGDAAWHRLQITHLREKAPFPGNIVDTDPDLTFATLHRLHALPAEIMVVPTHDRDAVCALAPV